MTRLIVARHGNTFGPNDPLRRVGARTDLELVQSGIEQGFQLGTYLKDNGLTPDIIIAGPLKRTVQTAKIAAAMLESTAPAVTIDERLREIDYGPDEGRAEPDVIARIGEEALKKWEAEAIPPEGWNINPGNVIQNWHDLAAEAFKFAPNGTVMIVTSNGIARFAPHITHDYEAFRQNHVLKLSTGAIGILDSEDGQQWGVSDWNIKPRDHI